MSLSSLRNEYNQSCLDERDINLDPIRQLRTWLDEAVAAGVYEPSAMALATATPDGHPSVRIVLLKGLDELGLTFHTCYDGRKGKELEANPHGAVVLFWPTLERQVRVEGRVERVSAEESDAYFKTRPLESQIGAWASPQSEVIASRADLETRYEDVKNRFAGREIPRPNNWGGLRLIPSVFEFWQGRPGRLHDRIRFNKPTEGNWRIERLAP